MSDDAKKLILARRARFLAATLATVTTAGAAALAGEGCTSGGSDQPNDGTSSSSGAQNCLSPPYVPPEGGEGDASTDSGEPQVCLTVAPDSGKDADPQPCLTPPIDGG